MNRGVGLGRLLGVPVRLDLSWFLGLAVVVALSRELWAPALSGVAVLGWSLLFAVAFFACVLVHELAHALAARPWEWPPPRSGCSCSAGWPGSPASRPTPAPRPWSPWPGR